MKPGQGQQEGAAPPAGAQAPSVAEPGRAGAGSAEACGAGSGDSEPGNPGAGNGSGADCAGAGRDCGANSGAGTGNPGADRTGAGLPKPGGAQPGVLRRLFSWRSHRPALVTHRLALPGWRGPGFRIGVLADMHVAAPWTTLADLRRAADMLLAQAPDMIVLGGDYIAGHAIPGRHAPAGAIAEALAHLRAPLGVFAIIGNHDWYDCPSARANGFTRCESLDAFSRPPFTLLRNAAQPVRVGGHELWIVGLDSQRPTPADPARPLHDPGRAFARVPEGAPAILLAHEPDYFAAGDARAGLQISGHTHGGQVNLLGWRPLTPSRFGGRYAHGLIHEGGRALVVSGGLGFSGFPLRINQPPEITLIELQPEAGPETQRQG